MKLLSIETSCDDTGITIMEVSGGYTNASFKVLAHTSNSQIPIHIPYGGVYPVLAKREHKKNLPILLEQALKISKLNNRKNFTRHGGPVDAIAVTYGPGLEMCLWEGILFAKELSEKWNVPIIPTNHMEGHIVSVFGKEKGSFKIVKTKAPILSLLVSGGHTQLVLSKKWLQYEIIGNTLDDAIGEAFDKVARMLDLPYPGGPQISKLASELRRRVILGSLSGVATPALPLGSSACETPQNNYFSLPRPMMYTKDFNFSFSGLKTAVLYLTQKIIKEKGSLDQETKAKIALEFENAAIECLTYKTKKAIEKYKIKTLIISGGVAANEHLKNEMNILSKKLKIKTYFPPKGLSGDNSLMIGMAGYLNYIKNKKKVTNPSKIKASGTLKLC